jgi:hypothetical protein
MLLLIFKKRSINIQDVLAFAAVFYFQLQAAGSGCCLLLSGCCFWSLVVVVVGVEDCAVLICIWLRMLHFS